MHHQYIPPVKRNRLLRQRGFTLAEIAVVVIIVGIMIGIAARNLGGSTDKANATSLIRFSQKVGENWSMISQNCGMTTDVNNSPLTGNSADNTLNLLVGGNSATGGGYALTGDANIACYQGAKVLPLTDSAQLIGTEWRVANHLVSLDWDNSTGQAYLEITFTAVPEAIALAIAQTYLPSLVTLEAAGSSALPAIHYGAVASGVTDVTLRRPL